MRSNLFVLGILVVGCNASKGDIDRSRCGRAMTLCTIGGTGDAGYNGQDGRATELQLDYPSALALDEANRILVSDAANFLVRRFDGDQLNTVVGTKRKGAAVSDQPLTGVDGTLLDFVSDMEFGPDGRMGMLESGGRQLSWVDFNAGNLSHIVSQSNEPGWNKDAETSLDSVELTEPSSFTFDDEGNIYLADAGLGVNLIYKIDFDQGLLIQVAGMDDVGFPLPSTSPDSLNNPQGLKWHNGMLYVADTGRHRIVTVDVSSGAVTNVVGLTDKYGAQDGGPFAEARLDSPSRFAFGPDGRMVIADTGNGIIRAEMMDGTIDTVCGRGAGDYDPNPQDPEGASLGQPFDVIFDGNGDLVFTDRAHAVVRRIAKPNW